MAHKKHKKAKDSISTQNTDWREYGAPDWEQVNRDALDVARRDRRRVYVEQDDRRYKLPNIEDFNHVPERQIHVTNGQVQEVKQVDLPRNVNIEPSSNGVRRRYYQNRTIVDRLRASICGKRKQRREVLFATKKTGKGASKPWHLWTSLSKIFCK